MRKYYTETFDLWDINSNKFLLFGNFVICGFVVNCEVKFHYGSNIGSSCLSLSNTRIYKDVPQCLVL